MLVLHGASDRVTDCEISKLLHEKAQSKDKTLRLYKDAWHCLLQGEPDEMIHDVMKDVISWLDARARSKTASAVTLQQIEETHEEFKVRVARAVPYLINFGSFHVPHANGSK